MLEHLLYKAQTHQTEWRVFFAWRCAALVLTHVFLLLPEKCRAIGGQQDRGCRQKLFPFKGWANAARPKHMLHQPSTGV